ncbi:MAG TPA: ATP-binding protein [Bryobacteraceae bacterium]|nr:ATP-binding protein [Bryobacteraceae bacterium]
MEQRARFWQIVRPQDIVWIALFAVLAIWGPDLTPEATAVLMGLGLMQIIEPKIPFFGSRAGSVISFFIKLALWYVLMGWTDGISSSYFWLMLLPVMSAATSLGLVGLVAAIFLACGAYFSLLHFLRPDQVVGADQWPYVILNAATFPIAGFLTYELLEANRAATRRAQRAAEQLAEANRHLQEAEAQVRRTERLAALGQLSAGLAHEIRNPLSTIKGSAEMLLKNVDADGAVAHELAGFISTEVDRTNALVTRFLDFARPLALRLEKTEIAEVIDEAVAQVEKHTPPLDVSIYKNYSPDIPPFLLDRQLIERVFYNLLLNAAQASPPQGTVTVKTRQFGETTGDDTVEISVIDRGTGIASKDRESIFNPFFTTKSSGVGLGLAIVSKIVDEHGGQITVESEPGAGSVFRVFLPVRENGK